MFSQTLNFIFAANVCAINICNPNNFFAPSSRSRNSFGSLAGKYAEGIKRIKERKRINNYLQATFAAL